MSLFGGSVREEETADSIMQRFGVTRSGMAVPTKKAMGHSVIWGASHVRADLLSLMSVKVHRDVGGVAVEAPKPPVLVKPAEFAEGKKMPMSEWIYSTQKALDTEGNLIGIVRSVDGFGLPAQIEPVDPTLVSFLIRGPKIVEYRVAGEKVDAKFIWHERQYTAAGMPVGLSPIAHAARSLAVGLAAQEFAYQWFEKGGVPSAVLANSEKVLSPETIRNAKTKFRESVQMGEPFVTGKDWTYTPIAAKAAESEFIQQLQLTDLDLCRFMGVPADLVDVVVNGGSSITYANLMQRNLQLLVMNLGGAVNRREEALSDLVVGGRYVKLNRGALLAMDAKTRAEVFKLRMEAHSITPDQIRAYEDEQPFDEADYAQLERLGLTGRNQTPNQPQTAGS